MSDKQEQNVALQQNFQHQLNHGQEQLDYANTTVHALTMRVDDLEQAAENDPNRTFASTRTNIREPHAFTAQTAKRKRGV